MKRTRHLFRRHREADDFLPPVLEQLAGNQFGRRRVNSPDARPMGLLAVNPNSEGGIPEALVETGAWALPSTVNLGGGNRVSRCKNNGRVRGGHSGRYLGTRTCVALAKAGLRVMGYVFGRRKRTVARNRICRGKA